MNHRLICDIAADVKKAWPRPYFGAVPYLDAMHALGTMRDSYGLDSALSIVSYFLANAGTWKGEEARRLKAELRALVAQGKDYYG